jgi:hypothetical protein
LEQALIRQYVVCRKRGVAEDNQSFADEALREYSTEDGKQKQHTGYPSQETRRSFREKCCHVSL